MNVFAKFSEIPSMILQDIKETKRFGHTVGRSVGLSDNVKTVYPPTNTVCGGYNKRDFFHASTVLYWSSVMFFGFVFSTAATLIKLPPVTAPGEILPF